MNEKILGIQNVFNKYCHTREENVNNRSSNICLNISMCYGPFEGFFL